MPEETPLSSLGISNRARGYLAKAGITTLEQAQAAGWEALRSAGAGPDTIAKLKAATSGGTAPGRHQQREKMRWEVYLNNLAADMPEEVALEKASRAVDVYFGGGEDV